MLSVVNGFASKEKKNSRFQRIKSKRFSLDDDNNNKNQSIPLKEKPKKAKTKRRRRRRKGEYTDVSK